MRGLGVREVADLRLRDEVDEQVRDPDLGDQVDEDRRHAEHEVAVAPERQARALDLGGALRAAASDGRQREARDHHGQHDEDRRHDQVGELHRLRVG